MKLDIIVNKYLLIWHLLYQTSINDEFHKLKQKIWLNNKREYQLVHKEKEQILEDSEDFIPNDDTIYNLIETSEEYKKIKKETNRYRLSILTIWGENRKRYIKEIKNILKLELNEEYKACIIHPELDVVEVSNNSNIITIGKKIITRDKDNFLTYLFYKIMACSEVD